MVKKICNKCGLEKEIYNFGSHNGTKDGLRRTCNECRKIETKLYRNKFHKRVLENKKRWRDNNKEKTKKHYEDKKDKIIEYQKLYLNKNREKVTVRRRSYYLKNREKILEKSKNYRKITKGKRNFHEKEKKRIDPIYKLSCTMRTRLSRFLSIHNITKRNKTFEIIGMTPTELKEHIEKQFTDGMNWGNHGQFGWHIDHRIPLDSAKTEDEIYKLCHYTNLQPLWWIDNIHKSAKIPQSDFKKNFYE